MSNTVTTKLAPSLDYENYLETLLDKDAESFRIAVATLDEALEAVENCPILSKLVRRMTVVMGQFGMLNRGSGHESVIKFGEELKKKFEENNK
jgi:hypothetical protein